MRYLKTYELFTGNVVEYEEGDIVVCVNDTQGWSSTGGLAGSTSGAPFLGKNKFLDIGKKYRVLKIYELPEDKYFGNKYARVDVEDIQTGEISKGWESTRFKQELEFDADKYNM